MSEKDNNRCAICGWPLSKDHCQRGDCSMRPFPTRYYDAERARKEYNPHHIPDEAPPTDMELLIKMHNDKIESLESAYRAEKERADALSNCPETPDSSIDYASLAERRKEDIDGLVSMTHRLEDDLEWARKVYQEACVSYDKKKARAELAERQYGELRDEYRRWVLMMQDEHLEDGYLETYLARHESERKALA